MKILLLKTITVLLLMLSSLLGNAQRVYKSKIGDGDWTTPTTWDVSTDGGVTYVPNTSSTPATGHYVIISDGSSVSISVSVNCAGIVVENNAKLYSKLPAGVALNINNSSPYPEENIIENNGVIASDGKDGSTGALHLYIANTVKKLTINGTGITNLSRIVARGNNPNKLEVIIDKDITFNNAHPSAAAFSAADATVGSRKITDDVTFIVNANKMVKLAAASAFHNSSTAKTTTTGGKYTYIIKGTLDLTGASSSYFTPEENVNSITKIEVSGLLKLPASFTSVGHTGTEAGKVQINVLATGKIDISANTTLNLGDKVFLNTHSSGSIEKTLASGIEGFFPIGSGTTYSPIWVKNTSEADNTYTVNVKDGIGAAAAININEFVNKQWSVQSVNPGMATIKLGWSAPAAGNDFEASKSAIYRSNDNTWLIKEEKAATISNEGDLSTAEACNCNTSGVFIVGKANETLPLELLSFEEDKNVSGANGLKWLTVNEQNVIGFDVERSTDGVNFNKIGYVVSKEGDGTKKYNFSDKDVQSGTYYYRLKSIDQDGEFSFSNIVLIYINKFSAISIHPNPVVDTLHINMPAEQNIKKVRVFSLKGQIVISKEFSLAVNDVDLDFSYLAAGYYTIEINNGFKNMYEKILKQ